MGQGLLAALCSQGSGERLHPWALALQSRVCVCLHAHACVYKIFFYYMKQDNCCRLLLGFAFDRMGCFFPQTTELSL